MKEDFYDWKTETEPNYWWKKPMKFIALYGSPTKLSNAHKLVSHQGSFTGYVYYVRADMIEAFDLADSLEKVRPMKGETVLNTVPIEYYDPPIDL